MRLLIIAKVLIEMLEIFRQIGEMCLGVTTSCSIKVAAVINVPSLLISPLLPKWRRPFRTKNGSTGSVVLIPLAKVSEFKERNGKSFLSKMSQRQKFWS